MSHNPDYWQGYYAKHKDTILAGHRARYAANPAAKIQSVTNGRKRKTDQAKSIPESSLIDAPAIVAIKPIAPAVKRSPCPAAVPGKSSLLSNLANF